MRRIVGWVLAILAAALAAGPPPARGTDVFFETRTYVPANGIESEETHVLLYEYLAFAAEDALAPGLYVRGGMWGRVDLADETFGRETNGDLEYAYVGWRAPQLNAEARAGRISLTSGVAHNEVFDGLLLGSDLPAGLDVTGFVGRPTETDEDGRSGDALYGGRLSQGVAGIYRLGASYLREENSSDRAREEAGADLVLTPLPLLEITGTSLYNVVDDAWSRHDYRLALGPFMRRVRLVGSWARTDYAHFFQAARNPALKTVLDDRLDRIGADLELELGAGFTLSGGYTAYRRDLAPDADAYGARLDWQDAKTAVGVGYRNTSGGSALERYTELTAHAKRAFGPVTVAVSGERLDFDTPIDGGKDATTGRLALSYAALRSLELSASAEYGETPGFDREVKGILALVWRYDAELKKGGGRP